MEPASLRNSLRQLGFGLVSARSEGTVRYSVVDLATGEPMVGGKADSALGLTEDQVWDVVTDPAAAGWDRTRLYAQRMHWWASLSEADRQRLLSLPERQPFVGFLISEFADPDFDWQVDMTHGEGHQATIMMDASFWWFLDDRRADAA